MFAISPEQSLLWLAIRQGWGVGQFIPNVTGGSAQRTARRGSIRKTSVTSLLSHRRATHALPSIG
jgi:hypothetical protein